MHIDWHHDERPAWEVVVSFATGCAWDHLDRTRLAEELSAAGAARHATVSAAAQPLAYIAHLRLKAEDSVQAATTGVELTDAAAARLGIPLMAVTCESVVACRRSSQRGLARRTGAAVALEYFAGLSHRGVAEDREATW